MIREQSRNVSSGYLALVVLPLLTLLLVFLIVRGAQTEQAALVVGSILALLVVLICFKGFFMVHPNQAVVLQLFGNYVGSVRITGLRWANPFYAKHAVSLRVRNFESEVLK